MNWRAAFVAHEWRVLLDQLHEAGTAGATAQLFDLYHRHPADWHALQLLIPQDATPGQRQLLDHLVGLSQLDSLEEAAAQLETIPAHLHLAFS